MGVNRTPGFARWNGPFLYWCETSFQLKWIKQNIFTILTLNDPTLIFVSPPSVSSTSSPLSAVESRGRAPPVKADFHWLRCVAVCHGGDLNDVHCARVSFTSPLILCKAKTWRSHVWILLFWAVRCQKRLKFLIKLKTLPDKAAVGTNIARIWPILNYYFLINLLLHSHLLISKYFIQLL